MKYLNNKILESIQRGINLAIDDIDDASIEYQKKSKIENNIHTRDLIGWVDLGLPSGTLWRKYNVGATNGDTLESWYGNYYAWGEIKEKDNYIFSTYKYGNNTEFTFFTKYCPANKSGYWDGEGQPDNLIKLQQNDDVAAQEFKYQCIPSREQIQELINETTHTWEIDYNGFQGLNGKLFTGKNGNSIFLPAGGYKGGIKCKDRGSLCFYWSSNINQERPDKSFYLDSGAYFASILSNYRFAGFSIRPVMNNS